MIRTPFFTVNPKSYLYGKELLDLAIKTDQLAKIYDLDIFFSAPLIELADIIKNTRFIIPTAQHMDDIPIGTGMGYACPEILKAKGVKATFLNHAEHPITMSSLTKTLKIANELNIITIVCADSIEDAKVFAGLNPDIILCEPTNLIGTGRTSEDEYMIQTNNIIRSINPKIKILQAAGISTPQDVKRALQLNADGTGATSGIVKAKDPLSALESMIVAVAEIKKEMDNQ